VSGQLHTPTALRGRTEPRPRLSGPQNRSRGLGEEKNSVPGIEAGFLWRPAVRLIAEQTVRLAGLRGVMLTQIQAQL
jgi:hypothetical protein